MLVTLLGITVFWQPVINVLVAVSIMALQPSRLSYTILPSATTIDVKAPQRLNATNPMLVTLLGIVTDFRPVQL